MLPVSQGPGRLSGACSWLLFFLSWGSNEQVSGVTLPGWDVQEASGQPHAGLKCTEPSSPAYVGTFVSVHLPLGVLFSQVTFPLVL